MATIFLAANLMSARLHYVMIFAHQDTPAGKRPSLRSVHSFASWAEVEGRDVKDQFTVSWVGVHGVRALGGSQPGRNLSLEETLREARCHGWRVSMFGPYRVTEDAFASAKRQFERLEWAEATRQVQYRLLDRLTWRSAASPSFHCVHALVDITGVKERTGSIAGVTASEFIVQTFLRHGLIMGSDPHADWVWSKLQPQGYEVARRTTAVSRFAETTTEIAEQPTMSPGDPTLLVPVGAAAEVSPTEDQPGQP